MEKVDKIAYSLSDLESQIFIRKFVTGKSPQDIQNELLISNSNYYRCITSMNEKLKDNKDYIELTESLKTDEE